jgi:DNA-binding NarL/FixJ family response regulator
VHAHPDEMRRLVAQRQDALAAAAAEARLTRRELEVLRLLAARWTDREIADALFISHRTATTHVARIRCKLGIRSRREVAKLSLIEDA